MKSNDQLHILSAARDAWLAASSLRSRRERYKRYTYGDQWSDMVSDASGHCVRESDLIVESGRKPLTNNMIRQIVKTVIGRYRMACREDGTYDDPSPRRSFVSDNSLLELDCRMLEEFLISGCAIQRIVRESRRGISRLWIDNVAPGNFFVNSFRDPRGYDIDLIGMTHDFSFPDLVARFASANPARVDALARIFGFSGSGSAAAFTPIGECDPGADDFFTAPPGRCRVIEVWTLDCRNRILCHDPDSARAFTLGNTSAARDSIMGINASRRRKGRRSLSVRGNVDFVWRCRWFAPDGTMIASYDSPYAHRSHPFALKLYPLTDGEVHSFVEDVIDQQRCINRMIVLIDHIIGSSAKGVLLFPQDQKPKDTDWREIADTWARSNGVIPVTGAGPQLPVQVMTSTKDLGAYELLSLQMKLFDNISGVSDVIAGRDVSPSTGSALYESRLRNSAVALADLIDSFAAFRKDRDLKASQS